MRIAAALVLALLAASCATTEEEKPPPRREVEVTPGALAARLLTEDGPSRAEAEARLVAGGRESAPAVLAALPGAEGESRLALLAVLVELDALPAEVGPEDRVDVLLWRLRGGAGAPGERTLALARLAGLGDDVRRALTERARRVGPDRPLALVALSRTGDPATRATLLEALEDEDATVRSAAAEGLRVLGEEGHGGADLPRARLVRPESSSTEENEG